MAAIRGGRVVAQHAEGQGGTFDDAAAGGASAGAAALAAEAELQTALALYKMQRPKPENYTGCMRTWIATGDRIFRFIDDEPFNNFIFGVIVVATILVGVQTYPSLDGNPTIALIDNIVLLIFAFEIVLKILSETIQPWKFLTGPNWRWNWFDTIIVIACAPFFDFGNSASVLRLMRLLRMGRLINKLPKLRVLISGMIGGLSSIAYISLLIALLLYLFAIMGFFLFGDNDPWHFGNFGAAMVTLFRMATLEDWTEVFYISYFGCEQYTGGLYVAPDNVTQQTQQQNVTFDFTATCAQPSAKPVLASIYFIAYINISALVLLSMFVGAISIAMSASIATISEENKKKQIETQKRKRERSMRQGAFDAAPEMATTLSVDEVNRRAKIGALVLKAWDGHDHQWTVTLEPTPMRRAYAHVAKVARGIVTHPFFINAITAMICVTGIMSGLDTSKTLEEDPSFKAISETWNWLITAAFTLEAIMKIVGFGFAPLEYFQDPWNRFDFVIVAGSYAPGSASMLKVLRLLRLLMVLKLIKSVPELRLVIEALMKGFGSIGYIGLLLVICFYFFAILGILLFRTNDPWHFKDLHTAFITLFRMSTFEDWTDVMYINQFGCNKYGYQGIEKLCTDPQPTGYASVVYCILFVMVGGLVMLNLFIGVITTSMEEAQGDMDQDAILDTKVRKLKEERGITDREVEDFRLVFTELDVDASKSLEEEELQLGLRTAGKVVEIEDVRNMMMIVDPDGSGSVDFAEFVDFMSRAKVNKPGAEGGGLAGAAKSGRAMTSRETTPTPSPGGSRSASPAPMETDDAVVAGVRIFTSQQPSAQAASAHFERLVELEANGRLDRLALVQAFTSEAKAVNRAHTGTWNVGCGSLGQAFIATLEEEKQMLQRRMQRDADSGLWPASFSSSSPPAPVSGQWSAAMKVARAVPEPESDTGMSPIAMDATLQEQVAAASAAPAQSAAQAQAQAPAPTSGAVSPATDHKRIRV